jgi:hypothetical protein
MNKILTTTHSLLDTEFLYKQIHREMMLSKEAIGRVDKLIKRIEEMNDEAI